MTAGWSSHKQQGRSVVKFMPLVAIALLMGLGTLEGGSFLYAFYNLKNQLRYELKTAALESDSEIRKKVVARAKRSGIVCAEQDILIGRKDGIIKLEMPYRRDVELYILGRQRRISSYDVRVVVESPVR